jgi:hypothetical protein
MRIEGTRHEGRKGKGTKGKRHEARKAGGTKPGYIFSVVGLSPLLVL